MSRAMLVMSVAVPCLLIGALGGWYLTAQPEESVDAEVVDLDGSEESGPELGVVELTPEKLAVMTLKRVPVETKEVRPTSEVPGRIRYDDRRHIEVSAATDGVLTKVVVAPGDRVEAGTVIAVMTSPAVGSARADVLKRQSELEVARKAYEWNNQIAQGLNDLTEAVEANSSLDDLADRTARLKLGEVRERIVTAYNRLRVAEKAAQAVTGGNTEILAARVAGERIAERDSAAAALKSLVEQSVFEARQAVAMAETSVGDAERRLDVAKEIVRTLLRQDDVVQVDVEDTADLSKVQILSPLSGTIEARYRSTNERVAAGDPLFVIADVQTLWVAADLREREWKALALQPGDALTIRLPFEGGQERTATVYFVGREVDEITNAVPLVAEIANADRLLRPGMFCRVVVPNGEPVSGLTVPEAAVQSDGEDRFVFVCKSDRSFARVDVDVQTVSSDVAVVAGDLSEGVEVVGEGAFVLKSELLLEGEE